MAQPTAVSRTAPQGVRPQPCDHRPGDQDWKATNPNQREHSEAENARTDSRGLAAPPREAVCVARRSGPAVSYFCSGAIPPTEWAGPVGCSSWVSLRVLSTE